MPRRGVVARDPARQDGALLPGIQVEQHDVAAIRSTFRGREQHSTPTWDDLRIPVFAAIVWRRHGLHLASGRRNPSQAMFMQSEDNGVVCSPTSAPRIANHVGDPCRGTTGQGGAHERPIAQEKRQRLTVE